MPRVLAGRYHLVRPLARGGMAEVWEGQDEVLSRRVAVKILMPHLSADAALRERFRREAVTAARLVHPGIVAIFDAGVETRDVTSPAGLGASRAEGAQWPVGRGPEEAWHDPYGTAFIVMELVLGLTLRDLLRERGPLPPRLAVGVALQVADALAYAHSLGLVHRDIKPANVLLRDEGSGLAQVKVADFGIAKAAAATSDLTAQGALLGTPKYVSPEQVRGEEPDARADLYSLGVVMFEMLAGEPPFRAPADMATALAHVQQPVPRLADACPEVPAELSVLVGQLLEKEPSRRVQSASELAARLAKLSRSLDLPVPGPGAFLDLGPHLAPHRRGPGPGTRTGVDLSAPEPATLEVGQGSRSLAATEVPSGGGLGTAAGIGGEAVAWPLVKRRPGRYRPAAKRPRRLVSFAVVALAAGGAAVVGALVYHLPPGAHGPGQRAGTSVPTGSGRSGPLKVLSVREVAINGNRPNDNVAELPNVISSKPGAYWQSAQYDGPRFGNYGGLGLALQLEGRRAVDELAVTTPMRDWSGEVFVADSFSSGLAGWGRPLDPQYGINGDHTFSFPARRGSWVLFWMMNPGPTYQATIEKLLVR